MCLDKFKCLKYLILLISIVFVHISVQAQAPKLVNGRILDKAAYDSKKEFVPFSVETDIVVFSFNTVAEAIDVQQIMIRDQSYTYEGTYAIPDESGYYSILLPETGALLIKAGIAEPVLEKVNGRREITTFIDLGIQIEEISVIGTRRNIEPVEPSGERYGNMLTYKGGVSLPRQAGKSNARMLIKPYVINHSQKGDTLCYRIPRVYDGKEFAQTQTRLVGFQENGDPLAKYVIKDGILDENTRNYVWSDTVILPNVNESFQVFADIRIEDYLGTYFSDILTLSPKNPRRPLHFLEYSFHEVNLDPQKYKENPKRELRSGVENISLKFKVGKAELDPEEPTNKLELERLKTKLLGIVNGESSTLKELHVTSVSSPDGSYAANVALSQRRLKYAEKLIFSMIPAYNMKRIYTYTKSPSRVAKWTEVADLMEADSLITEAQGIRDVVLKNENRFDAQSIRIRHLPYYKTKIVDYLPKLRSMKCEYQAEIYRALTPEEILERYNKDLAYREGKKQFELYEYWHLFNMVKDTLELETLYRQAYEFSRSLNRNKKPWALAANNLAVSYIARDTVDTSILEPLIDRSTRGCNVKRTFNGRVIEVVNIEEIVANQLIMYLKAEDFDNASIMAQILPDIPKYETLRAFAYCLKGYYKYKASDNLPPEEIEYRDRVFRLVQSSSPLNNVVMCLAMNNARWNKVAEMGLSKLPKDDPKTLYLTGIVYLRMGDAYYMQAQNAFIECFKRDKSYIELAKTDGDVNEDFFKETMEMYELTMELQNLNGGF